MDEISLDALALKQGMSPRNFIRRFKQVSGETPLAYLQKLRVEASKKLLEKGHLKIAVIAGKVGCQTEAHFRKLFRRYTSLTPAAFRSKHSNVALFER